MSGTGRLETKASLAPIIVALLVLVSVALLGLAVAWWPDDRPAASARAFRDQAAPPAPGSFDSDCLATSRNVPRPKWT